MGDHHDHHHDPVAGPFAGGWALALGAGLAAAALASQIAGVGQAASGLVAALAFLVTGVLLGSGGVELTLDADDHQPDGHGHH